MSIRTLAATAALLGSTISAHAQIHVAGLVGDTPDTSTWPHPAAPAGNPFPRSTAPAQELILRDRMAQLGKLLFWDEQLSSDNTVACGSCHMPRTGGTDDRFGAVHANGNFGTFGVIPQAFITRGRVDYGFLDPRSPQFERSVTPLNAPTMIGAYVFERLFWDLRAGPMFDDGQGGVVPGFSDFGGLEDLAVEPPVSPVEMGHEALSWSDGFIQSKLGRSFPLALVDPNTIPADARWLVATGKDYNGVFDIVFDSHVQFGTGMANGVTRERFACAMAHYLRTLIPDQAPIDLGTMNDDEAAGFVRLQNSGCFFCHSATGNPTLLTPNGIFADAFDSPLSDGQAHFIGISNDARKAPTLRNVGLHRKFFSTGHGGNGISQVFVTNLDELVSFYEAQPGITGFGGRLQPQERAQVLAFLGNALTDPRVAREQPPFDRPTLYAETHPFRANRYGRGAASRGLRIPEIIANAPPHVVQPGERSWFKVGAGNAPPRAAATLAIGTSPAPGPIVWVGGQLTFLTTTTNGTGLATIQQPIPMATAVLGVPFYAQWFFVPSSGQASSNAAEFVPFRW